MFKRILLTILLFDMTLFLWSGDLSEIQSKGSITAGIRKLSTATYLGEEFTNKGFCYDIASAFSKDLDVELKLNIVENFTDYWKKDGRIVFKTDRISTPDIYGEIDLVADIVTLTEQREKYVSMVPFVENTEIYFGKKELEVHSYDDLRGLRLFTLEGISFLPLVKGELDKRNIPYVVNAVKVNENTGELEFPSERQPMPEGGMELLIIPKGTEYAKFEVYNQIFLDHADISIQDSFSFFLHYSTSIPLKTELKPMMPVGDQMGFLAFCTSLQTDHLNRKLAEFMDNYRESDEFDELFRQYMGISYSDYQILVSITQQVEN